MKKLSAPKLNRQILEEASDWFVDFRVGDVDAVARERFDEWLRQSPEHIRAYWEIAKTYVELPTITPPEKLDVTELIAYAHSDDNVVPLHPSPSTQGLHELPANSTRANPGRGKSPVARRRFFAAASVALVLAIGGAVYWQTQRYPLFATDIGERRSITLVDGSTVDLNARSRLRIEFTRAERHVELLEGQALFQVAKDKNWPFIVHSGDATVRAVGTQFDVYRKDNGTTVTVLEGRVAVYSAAHARSTFDSAEQVPIEPSINPPSRSKTHTSANGAGTGATASVPTSPPGLLDASGISAVFLSAGEQVTVAPDAIVSPQHTDVAAATAWMQRKLIFEGTKLYEVVKEFDRYNRTQLVIDDPRLRELQISGVYSSTDPASLLRFLRDQGLRVTETDNEIRIDSH